MWLAIQILSVLFMWFLRASGIVPDLSWLFILAPVWVPWLFSKIWAGKGSKRTKSRGRTKSRPSSKRWRSVGNIF